ncbi:hypothetical protein [Pelagerythrobacter marinus]|uniref:hypothetical protein n=1 Tax=Pelagerythrobacter marinus TaxID=538382 RepID=UPI002AC99865|nr:hypothetical protein [Pelagerythrobacter marinus]WPZ05503.1 hypothetical protein T8T98_08660 [Pelagerythrobacter marinus]
MLPKKAGDEIDGELLARGYWRMIGQSLTEAEMSALTELVLDRCRWFPTVAECRDLMREKSYTNPFYRGRRDAELTSQGYERPKQLTGATIHQITDARA